MNGSVPGQSEPLTWTRAYKDGKVFFTSLGHPDDFKEKAFRKLLVNALFWSLNKKQP